MESSDIDNNSNYTNYQDISERKAGDTTSSPLASTDPSSKVDSDDVACHRNLGDCCNVSKGFIGAAVVGLPFAISQTGIGFALIGIGVIAVLTDHCCMLILKCKSMVIRNIIDAQKEHVDEVSLRDEEEKLQRDLSYGHISKVCLGTSGIVLTNTSLMISQLGFTINYLIFLGNTIRWILKYFLVKSSRHVPMVPMHNVSNDSLVNLNYTLIRSSITLINKLPVPSTLRFLNSTVGFMIFLFAPVAILLLIAVIIRNIRKLSPFSVVANCGLLAGFGTILIYIIISMKSLPDSILWFKLSAFPILFGQVVVAFEGIGVVVPVESSMVENRAKYPTFLHISVLALVCILSGFGVSGYLAYGNETCQIITGNLVGPMAIFLQSILFIGILFTYPLQIYPCFEISEHLVLKIKQWKTKDTGTRGV